jgi:phytoene desaturase
VTQDVIVIGAGVGGITAAARLAQRGYRVTVLEKNDAPGGRCGYLDVDGHRFDTGATMLLMPEFYASAFHDLGERMEDHLALTRVDPTYRLHFGDGSGLELTSDRERMREQLEAIERGSYAAFLRYMEDAARHYRLAVPRFMAREYRTVGEFLSPSNLLMFARLNLLTRQYDDVGRYFQDERLRTAFTFQNLYLGLSPYAAPATFSLIQHTEFADGIWAPKGGMYRVVEALVSIAEKAAVRFVYDAPVARIDVRGDRATGVTMEDGRTLDADVVLANADLPYVYRRLLPQDGVSRRLERKKYGTSALTFLWGMDRKIPEFGTHNLFFASDIRGGYAPLFDGRGLPDDPHFYVYAPSRMDPSMAPPGQDSIMVALPSAHIDERHPQDWDAIRERTRAAVLHRLEAFGLGDLKSHIKFERTVSPPDWVRRYNLVKGSTHGLSYELTQVAYFRPHNRHAHYRNLYFVGASTHPGTGLPNVLVSGRFAAQRILDDERAHGTAPDIVTSPTRQGARVATPSRPLTEAAQ